MTDTADFDGVAIWADEDEAIVANAQPQLVFSLERSGVARA